MMEIESKRLKGSGVGKYKGLKQITFVHKLAYDKLLAYKQEAQKKGYLLNDDSPIFIAYWNKGVVKPITIKGINNLFDDFSLDAFGDLEKKRFSPHDLREFFQSALENAGVPANMISPIMAHKVAGVDQHYSSHDFKELLVKYESALSWLIPKSIEKVKAETEEIKAKYEKLEDEFATQLAEKQKETLKAVFAMLKLQGVKVNWEKSGEEP